jgi:rhodanese-related sulfurtransferase
MNIERLLEFGSNHPALFMALFALLALLIGGELRRRISGVVEITPAEATRMMNQKNAVAIDIRADREFAEGHISNAVHLTEDPDTSVLEKYRDRPLIVYCNSGNRSVRVCHRLRKQGFADTYHLKGGVLAWRKAELPLNR